MHGYPGINRLAQIMITHSNNHLPEKATRDWADFGTIGSDGSLTPDNFPVAFPLGSYAVLEPYLPPRSTPEVWNTTNDALIGLTDTGTGSSGASLQHHHSMVRPPVFTVLQTGDRVLIVYANDTDPCVVGKVYWSFQSS